MSHLPTTRRIYANRQSRRSHGPSTHYSPSDSNPRGVLWEKVIRLSPRLLRNVSVPMSDFPKPWLDLLTLICTTSWRNQFLVFLPWILCAPKVWGEIAGDQPPPPLLSSRWQEHHLDCSTASDQAKDNSVFMHRNTLCFSRSQESKSQ